MMAKKMNKVQLNPLVCNMSLQIKQVCKELLILQNWLTSKEKEKKWKENWKKTLQTLTPSFV